MTDQIDTIEDLNSTQKAHLVLDFLHRIVVHYGLWFSEVRHQMGPEKALEVLKGVFDRSSAIQLKRLGKPSTILKSRVLPNRLSWMALLRSNTPFKTSRAFSGPI